MQFGPALFKCQLYCGFSQPQLKPKCLTEVFFFFVKEKPLSPLKGDANLRTKHVYLPTVSTYIHDTLA